MQQKNTIHSFIRLILATSSVLVVACGLAQAEEFDSEQSLKSSFVASHTAFAGDEELQQIQEPTPMGSNNKKKQKKKNKKNKKKNDVKNEEIEDEVEDFEDVEDEEGEEEFELIEEPGDDDPQFIENKQKQAKSESYCEKDKEDPKEDPKCPKSAKFCFWNDVCYEGDDVIAYYGPFERENFSKDQAPLSFRKRKKTARVEIWSKPNYEGDCAVIGKKNKSKRSPTLPFPVRSARTVEKGQKSLCKSGEP